ncbi:helix-turn-helix transcriptional regulator [Microlunatus ginsengisoli]|uniref:Helix-turn-helix transcriptional regulator n=1 Tax=Microlunatus ginsengisoli TaxID=363863 RepID=A0ABP6ZLQ6_9ACTN
MWWRPDQLDLVETALATSAAGVPTLLSIEGDPGQGKTSLVREVRERAAGRQLLTADGVESLVGVPYATIAHWPLPAPIEPDTAPFQAAQQVRRLVDRLALVGPVVICLDDLQWCDAETVETLGWVIGRAAGDRLLVAAASRPLHAPAHPTWRRLLLDERTVRIRLTGLQPTEGRRLVEQASPGLEPGLAARLLEHTGGNPLYLKALLAEHDPGELRVMDDLPAPDDVALGVAGRLDELPADTADLVTAVSVLGDGWVPVRLAAGLGGVESPLSAAEPGIEAGLLELRRSELGPQLRTVHAVIAAAVRAVLPPDRRRQLHLRAAELVEDRSAALQQRIAAADQYDDVLATDLAAYAAELHGRGTYREAGRFLRWSSASTSDAARRQARWLDSVFEYVLARDDETVSAILAEVEQASDPVRRALVTAGLAIVVRRWLDARRILEAVEPADLDRTDGLSRYRLVVLRGWSRITTGAPIGEALPDLTWARDASPADPAMYSYLIFGLGMARAASEARSGWRPADTSEPRSATPAADSARLAWRGLVYTVGGRFDEGADILAEIARRIRDGRAGLSDGIVHACLGYASWMRGDWAAARRNLALAVESRFGLHPMAAAYAPLLDVARNDLDATAATLRAARGAVRDAPWSQAVGAVGTAEVIVGRLTGGPAGAASAVAELRAVVGDAVDDPGISPVWAVHLCLSKIWSGQPDYVETIRSRWDFDASGLVWARPVIDWLTGLAAEQRHDLEQARRSLSSAAAAGGMDSMPFHRALVSDDLARVNGALGYGAAAKEARQDAADRFGRLGLIRDDQSAAGPEADVLAPLSDRERDVVGLLVEGLSYAQIARELFITRHTVGYHLSNAYAKTNTTSRHQLVELIRSAG